MPKEVDGISPEWPRCSSDITGRLRIAQALSEEMSPEQQQQRQLRGPSGPATQLLGGKQMAHAQSYFKDFRRATVPLCHPK